LLQLKKDKDELSQIADDLKRINVLISHNLIDESYYYFSFS
jgi:hypothetical protein